MIHCPNCGYKQICPCSECIDFRNMTEERNHKPWQWVKQLVMRCSNCGFEKGSDWWGDLLSDVDSWHEKAIKYSISPDLTTETLQYLKGFTK